MTPGTELTLRPEKPAAGGRMIARHDGMVVLVAGAIPGELVRARVERVQRSVAFADVTDVIEPHPSRREPGLDPRCGGAAYAHIAVSHQLLLKGQVIEDALGRLAHVRLDRPVVVAASPERGYRMRARLHMRGGRAGFFLEGTHRVCDAAATGQLLDVTGPVLSAVFDELKRSGLGGDADIELSENMPGDQRAIHVELHRDAEPRDPGGWRPVPGVTGLGWSVRGVGADRCAWGLPTVIDAIDLGPDGDASVPLRLQRHVRAFFQGNRFLLPTLLRRVTACCPTGSVIDLYSGVGLFAVALAATGRHRVTAVEGDRASAVDLAVNSAPFGGAIDVRPTAVEEHLRSVRRAHPFTVVIDPPRTGMTREAAAGVVALGAEHIVFVSCDVATFARDVRRFLDAGYRLDHIEGFDLFPNTAHVEVLATLSRG